jgi:hypothetical protein
LRIAPAPVHEPLSTRFGAQRRRIVKRSPSVVARGACPCRERLLPFLQHRLPHRRGQVCDGLFARQAWSQTADHVHPQERRAHETGALATEQWLDGERHCEIRRLRHVERAGKSLRCDADDGERHLVDEDGLAEDARIAIEAPGPVLVRDGRHRRRASPVILLGERPAECRANAEATKVIARDVLSRGNVGAPVDDDVQLLKRIESEELSQRAVGLLQPAKRGIRERRTGGAARRLVYGPDAVHAPAHALTAFEPVEQHQVARRRNRQRLEQQFVHDSEEGGIRADTDCQRQDCGEREARIAAQLSRRVA